MRLEILRQRKLRLKERVVGWKHRRSSGDGHETAPGCTSSRTTLGGNDRSAIFEIDGIRAGGHVEVISTDGRCRNQRAA